ncbi:hypothetical protein N7456_000391 [Penicillium angulare]|uniref:FAD-binding domain-containing protein n=1 Tax=Penicillium angulare TaxID=116970 RepID=A0A9W9KRV2_9EURO|nr:hypothetical protein N7456_000391 [Penicillium angulare]
MTQVHFRHDTELPPGSTGLKVIVVGLGIGGIAAAVECHRRGHTVIGFEKSTGKTAVGDSLGIGFNAALVFDQWGGGSVAQALNRDRGMVEEMVIYDENGDLVAKSDVAGFDPGNGYLMWRYHAARAIEDHAQTLGLDLHYGVRVEEYWENDHQAGIIVDGNRISADCVIVADGVNSRGRSAIKGDTVKLQDTGNVAFRGGFESGSLQNDPTTQWLFEGVEEQDRLIEYIGKNVLVMIGTGRNGKDIDDPTETERYEAADVDEALRQISHWPVYDKIATVIGKMPERTCYKHRLFISDPINEWVSPKGRMIMVGDAAHPMVPTLGQGASQAVEDSAVVAICLQLCAGDVSMGLKAAQAIRAPRATLIQRAGVELLTAVHANGSEDRTTFTRPYWIYLHDCQRHAYQEYSKVVQSLKTGVPYSPTNIPAGATWNVGHEAELGPKIQAFRAAIQAGGDTYTLLP